MHSFCGHRQIPSAAAPHGHHAGGFGERQRHQPRRGGSGGTPSSTTPSLLPPAAWASCDSSGSPSPASSSSPSTASGSGSGAAAAAAAASCADAQTLVSCRSQDVCGVSGAWGGVCYLCGLARGVELGPHLRLGGHLRAIVRLADQAANRRHAPPHLRQHTAQPPVRGNHREQCRCKALTCMRFLSS